MIATGAQRVATGHPLQLSKFRVKLGKLMKPVAALAIATGRERARMASNGSKTGQQWLPRQISMGYNGHPLQTRFVAVLLPLGDFWRMQHICSRRFPTIVLGLVGRNNRTQTGDAKQRKGITMPCSNQ